MSTTIPPPPRTAARLPFGRPGPPPDEPGPVQSLTVRRRRRRPVLLAAAAVRRVSHLVPVLAVAQPVGVGARITDRDLVTAQVAADPNLKPMAAADRALAVGSYAASDLKPGMLLTRDAITSVPVPAPGMAVVWVTLKATNMPAAPLVRGDRVLLVLPPSLTGTAVGSPQPSPAAPATAPPAPGGGRGAGRPTPGAAPAPTPAPGPTDAGQGATPGASPTSPPAPVFTATVLDTRTGDGMAAASGVTVDLYLPADQAALVTYASDQVKLAKLPRIPQQLTLPTPR